ncbi:hypothetical protein EVAR_95615_1 [Eumeta japonica]|uniref:Uncharacterized protein n=1 Tax=Eumeta variegata TaxID=151549 RepID=A0A4C1VMK3_EUMVA|nr:hypothetical protein EVAR_95615_1 [Eumeta japonica]
MVKMKIKYHIGFSSVTVSNKSLSELACCPPARYKKESVSDAAKAPLDVRFALGRDSNSDIGRSKATRRPPDNRRPHRNTEVRPTVNPSRRNYGDTEKQVYRRSRYRFEPSTNRIRSRGYAPGYWIRSLREIRVTSCRVQINAAGAGGRGFVVFFFAFVFFLPRSRR